MEGNNAQATEGSGRAVRSDQSRAIYWSQAHKLALERLNFAVASRVPMTVFVGRSGTGRTMLLREMIATNTSSLVIRVLGSLARLSGEVPSDVISAFTPKRPGSENIAQNREKLVALLQSLHAAQRYPVLVVDDADELSNLYLGGLCDLCDQAVDGRPLLKLVFVGQPNMTDILSGVRPDLVGPAFKLDCMNEQDSVGYLKARLGTAGVKEPKLDKSATRELFALTSGIPAKLNAICDAVQQDGSDGAAAVIDKAKLRQIAASIRAPDRTKTADTSRGDHTPADPQLLARANQVAGILQTASEADQAESPQPRSEPKGFARKAGFAAAAVALIGAGAYLMRPASMSGGPTKTAEAEDVAAAANLGSSASVLARFVPGTAAAAEARVGRIASALAEAEPTASGQYLAALDLAETAPDAAAVGYARAALSGHARSAYYLGQIYETGEGVPVDLVLARLWYGKAAPHITGAAARLQDMERPAEAGAVAAPTPLFSKKMVDGLLDLVWTSGEGADPAAYRVELSSTFSDTVLYSARVTTSALRLKPPQAARTWRVIALDANGRELASPWMEIRLN